ncbi:MAG: V-type ATPase subunit, partial [Candidatus Caldarchaeum sp.]
LKALFTRYVYFNIKTILKSRALGLAHDEILKRIDLYPEELLGVRDTALRALTAKDLGEFLKEFLATPYHSIVQKAVEIWNNRRDFSAVDAVIDKGYIEQLYKAYRKTPRDERKLLQHAMVLEIDLRALAIAIRGRLWGLVPSNLKEFLPEETVEVPRQLLDILVESDDVKKVLSQLPENPVFSRIRAEQDVAQVVSAIEETVKSYRVKWASQSFYKTPFKQLNLIAFIYLKEAEVRNLSTIAKYIEEGVSDVSVIKSSLLLV